MEKIKYNFNILEIAEIASEAFRDPGRDKIIVKLPDGITLNLKLGMSFDEVEGAYNKAVEEEIMHNDAVHAEIIRAMKE